MTLPTITALPTAPSRTDPSTFASRGDAFVAALATLRSEINTWGTALPGELTTYAPLASPTFTGTPTLPTGTVATTQSPGDSTTKVATTAFTTGAVATAQAAGKAGDFILITDTTISGTPSAVDFTSGISSTYDQYMVTLSAVKPSTDGVQLNLRTSTNAGSSFDAGGSDYGYGGRTAIVGSGAEFGTTAAGQVQIAATIGNASNEEGVSGVLYFWKPSAASPTLMQWQTVHRESTAGSPSLTMGCGMRQAAADVDAIRFLLSSGTFASGRIKLFGRKV